VTSTTVKTPFLSEGKSLHTQTAANGDLLISGWAARFDGIDRHGEQFAEGSFQHGIKSFLEGNHPLCYHHQHDKAIGEVLSLKEVPGEGLWMTARVDSQPESSPLRWIYNAIKSKTISHLSVGGFFRRKVTAAGVRIVSMDFTEISCTAVPVFNGTSFAVSGEGKALTASVPRDTLSEVTRRMDYLQVREDLQQLQAQAELLDLQTRVHALTH